MKPYICNKMDWDHEVIDVFLIIGDDAYSLKGFDDIDWKDANTFSQNVADALSIENKGDLTDT